MPPVMPCELLSMGSTSTGLSTKTMRRVRIDLIATITWLRVAKFLQVARLLLAVPTVSNCIKGGS